MMLLFPEIDRKKTKKKVHDLLKTYRSLVRIAGEKHSPKVTAAYRFEMNNTEGQFAQKAEKIIDRKHLAEVELAKIIDAMNQLDVYDREILYDKYMDRNFTTNIAIYMKHHMSESKFYRELDKAMVRFAESYESGKLLIEK
ncbi:ArpU family phage packaging/lysis transcriptional regulator [Enterococcus quebecensis]|uniref:ArpU family transcriptional regulator n=1 Tax=Enterococcus quebecensis TaxID=903983 RepID=A0A1E5H2W3_9ENTE|nr:ArpU family phage packaging/lysis transcriptional regulator [Enterococcus quebecensis]OEG19337.1 ArpU family transcriptional regulator [Enterococcus quebecensis]OJG75744.1 ArpU family phage transcriptional regulator [Enterococcus quebecensis]